VAVMSSSSLPVAPPLLVNLADLAAAQQSCPDCERGLASPALNVMCVKLPGLDQDNGTFILVDTSSGVLRPLIPASFRHQIFEAIHSLAHSGISATHRLISSRYVWPQLAADIATWYKACQSCSRAMVTKQPATDTQAIAVPTTHISHIHVDIVWPIPATADGSAYILTAVDRTTRWVEAYLLKNTTTANCLAALTATGSAIMACGPSSRQTIHHLIQVPRTAESQRAPHPQSNGLVEWFHRPLNVQGHNGHLTCPGPSLCCELQQGRIRDSLPLSWCLVCRRRITLPRNRQPAS
jgi:Integrase zinc binding domain